MLLERCCKFEVVAIMYASFPYSHEKYKEYVEVTCCHYILYRCNTYSNTRHLLSFRNTSIHINCSNTVLYHILVSKIHSNDFKKYVILHKVFYLDV